MKQMLAALVLFTAVLAGCGTGFNREAMRERMKGDPAIFGEAAVQAIEALKPQLQFPCRLAVAPPLDWSAWSQAERDEIQSWAEPLRRAGVISEIVIIPRLIVDQRHAQPLQAAAARFGADALLILAAATDVDRYVNPLSVSYLTIGAMWCIPGSHRDALTMIEGVMLDVRNGYLYAAAEAEGQARQVRPWMYADDEPVRKASRLEALKAFGAAFVPQAARLRPGSAGERYSTDPGR